ncbi:MAG: putative rane protein [Pseudonocardiales bacterium]|jgi:YggT family protein|nr:putative rane protein [Jatrophihabitantaceae bacterium]MCW2537698.1 putative rane protein [Modestobacter sp.]MCW2603061.1 putative rane protein [Pseudonocardiales bacterium]
MRLFWLILAFVVLVYWLLVLARIVIETTRSFARQWWPSGAAAVGIEVVYSTTDPPIKLLRRLVPPLRLGGVSLDVSVLILLLFLIILRGFFVGFAQ